MFRVIAELDYGWTEANGRQESMEDLVKLGRKEVEYREV